MHNPGHYLQLHEQSLTDQDVVDLVRLGIFVCGVSANIIDFLPPELRTKFAAEKVQLSQDIIDERKALLVHIREPAALIGGER